MTLTSNDSNPDSPLEVDAVTVSESEDLETSVVDVAEAVESAESDEAVEAEAAAETAATESSTDTSGDAVTGESAAEEGETPEEVKPDPVVDPLLLASSDIARAALAEITDTPTIGDLVGHEAHEDHVLSLYFECLHPGYVGWRWTATLSRLSDSDEVNILEVELLPGETAVVAPDWVPWSERLSNYRKTQAKLAADEMEQTERAAAELAEEDEVDPEDDLLENDYSDFDDEIDGVELDEGDDESGDSEDESDDDDSDDDDSDDDDDDSDDEDESDDTNEEDSEDDDFDDDAEDADDDE